MALKVKAVERLLKFDKESAGKYRYVMKPEMYSSLTQAKVIKEAALRSGVNQGVMKACWDAAGEVIKAWATEGHSVALPGLGTMRFGLRSKAVENVNDVKTSLITSRRIIFTPSVDLKDELANTAIQITCIDRNGNEVKRVTSTSGDVEDPEDGGDDNGGGDNGGGSSQNGGTNSGSGSGSQNSGSGTNTGSNTGGNSGSQSGSGESGVAGNYRLVIYKYGSGTSNVTDANGQELPNDSSVASGSNVNISVVPAEGKVPTAKVNGNSITLTENNGTYTGSFVMPTKGTVVEVNSEPSEYDFGDDY
jgi:nucleoid DNA-binding protein